MSSWTFTGMIKTAKTYSGELSASGQAVPVLLPEESIVDEIFLKPGQSIYAGQTIALLDRDSLRLDIARVESELQSVANLLQCLNHPNVRVPYSVDADSINLIDANSCELEKAKSAEKREHLTSKAEAIVDSVQLITEYLATELKYPSPDPQERKRTILMSVLLKQTEIRLAEAVQDRLNAEYDFQNQILQRSKAAFGRIDHLSQQKARLEKLSETPRILSPVNGVVSRVRTISDGQKIRQTQPIAEIIATDTPTYEAWFTLPIALADQIEMGSPTKLKVIGGFYSVSELTGQIAGTKASTHNSIRVIVELDAESSASLALTPLGTSLQTRGSAVKVSIQSAEEPLRETLWKAFIGSHLLRSALGET